MKHNLQFKTEIQLEAEENLPLLVFSGLVLEVIYSLPEERDTEQAAVVVFKQQPGGEDTRCQINIKAGYTRLWKTHFNRFPHTE